MSSFTCRPDRYLSATELTGLFEEFNTSIIAGQSSAAIFSSLVNSVRQAYLSVVIETGEQLLCQFRDHARELAALRKERNKDRGSPSKCHSEAVMSPAVLSAPTLSTGEADKASLVAVSQTPDMDVSWPGKTFTLLVGSTDLHYRRDMAGWGNMDVNGWTLRLELKVFKYQEPGTIKLYVTETYRDYSKHRIMVDQTETFRDEWRPRMEFYAYSAPRPGTDRIWVGHHGDPERCILVKGGNAELMPGWSSWLEFWVPK